MKRKRKTREKLNRSRRKPRSIKAGMTLVEVLMSVLLVGAGAAFIYEGSMYSYKTLMRSRARLSAQGIAFDKLWGLYNLQSTEELMAEEEKGFQSESTPLSSVFSTNGQVRWVVHAPGTNYWNIWVRVYAFDPDDSAYDNGTVLFPTGRDPVLAEYVVRRSNRMR